jgi:hypothetical protein
MNQEQFTLREIIQQRFEELDSHIAALDAVTVKHDIPSFLTTYNDLKTRYEFEALSESLGELEDRLVMVESYQTVQRFVIRQIVVVGFTVLLVIAGFALARLF